MTEGSGQSEKENGIVPTKTAASTYKKVISAKVYDIYSFPPSHSYKAAFVPKPLTVNRGRKISIEVHRVTTITTVNPKDKKKSKSSRSNLKKKKGDDKDENFEEEKSTFFEECVVRMWYHRSSKQEDAEDGTVLDTVIGQPKLDCNPGVELPDADDGWKVRYWLPLKNLALFKIKKNTVVLDIAQDKLEQRREIGFDLAEDCRDFVNSFAKEKDMEDERMDMKLHASLNGVRLRHGETITFLIEIVSAWEIPAGDLTTSDPFAICSINGAEVHRTQHISKTLEPIWTLKTGSLFLLTIESKELFSGDGLSILLMDYDSFGANEALGCVIVPPYVLYRANGERMVFTLQPAPGMRSDEVSGCLSIRCRRATAYDKKFMQDYASSEAQDALGLGDVYESAQAVTGGKGNLKSMMQTVKKVAKDGKNAGHTVYKVRPTSDPKRAIETEWMTDKQVQDECLKDSDHWIDSGSGKLGRLYLEILGCDDLPNMDTGGMLGNKTDAFVAVVFEDTILRTDIIDDCLSPRWLPWTKRAFIFNMIHSSSELFIGVFDYDQLDDHDVIGRVSVDLSNLRKNTMYTLKFGLFTTAKMSSRRRKGTITIRLRMEIDDDRKFLLSNLEPPPQLYVNVKTRKDFKIAHATCNGKFDMDTYSMKAINSHIEELLAYQHALYYLQDGLIALLLWRSHFCFKIFGREYRFPLHSLIAFISSVILIENPQLFPSFFFLSVAWMLLAVMEYRRGLPDAWSRCKTYGELLRALVFGDCMTPPDSIEPYQNYQESQEFLEYWKKRVAESEERAAAAFKESQQAQEEYEKEMNEIGEATTDISTKKSAIQLDPFKPLLFPIQNNLGMLCQKLRYVRFVVFWEECYFSFWISTACFVIAFAFLFVPWFFILRWATRVFVWVIFGPWMKLVDVLYFSKIKPPSEEEVESKKQQELAKRRIATSAAVDAARIKRENALKLRDIKKFMFGDFITKVPVLKQDRYRDSPLPESSAVPYRPEPVPLAELAMKEAGYRRTRLPGQHLVGDMIPRVEAVSFTDAPTGQATAHPDLLDKKGPLTKGSDSTASAYAQLGSVFVIASLVTWFGVPFLALGTEKVLSWF